MPVDWAKGVGYSIVASIIGGGSKLAIRKSWLMVVDRDRNPSNSNCDADSDASQRIQDSNDGNLESCENTYQSPEKIRAGTDNININVNESAATATAGGLSPHPPQLGNMEIGPAFLTESENEREKAQSHKTALALRFSGMIGMTFLNPLFCVLAMNYASPSILAPFSGLTLVWIVLFSETMIEEKPNGKQIAAAFFIVFGEVIVAVWGDHTNDEGVGLDDLVESYKRPSFQLYFVCMFFWMMALVYIIIHRPSATLRRFAWGVSGGSITGFQNFLKDSLTIIKAVNETGEPYPWYLYIMVTMAMASSFGGLLFLTACMKRYDATFSSAMFVGSFVISASIMAAVHYQTFQHLESLSNFIMYPTGLIVLMIGVRMLVNATSEQDIEYDTGADGDGDVDVDGNGDGDFNNDTQGYVNINDRESSGSVSPNEMRHPFVLENQGKID